jgi:hypothetical protein
MTEMQGINSIELSSIRDLMYKLYPNGNARTAKSVLKRKVYLSTS